MDLDSARAIAEAGIDEGEMAAFTRKGEDMGLVEAAAVRSAAPTEGEAVAPPTKLRMDIGWSTWKKPKVCRRRCGIIPGLHPLLKTGLSSVSNRHFAINVDVRSSGPPTSLVPRPIG